MATLKMFLLYHPQTDIINRYHLMVSRDVERPKAQLLRAGRNSNEALRSKFLRSGASIKRGFESVARRREPAFQIIFIIIFFESNYIIQLHPMQNHFDSLLLLTPSDNPVHLYQLLK